MIVEDPHAFICPGYIIRAASAGWEHGGAASLRHRVFVEEQGLFAPHDRDAIDQRAITLVALSTIASEADEVVGTVRLHAARRGAWWGSRLAVAPGCRRVGPLGTELIRLAVGTAMARGCGTFLAHVQARNIPLFRRIGWEVEEEVSLHGAPHARMRALLPRFTPVEDPCAGRLALARRRRAS
ncbi:MSMEG_0567/Sll0786 family nitrogen starvation N-acetyltransferase [Rhodovulum sp. DZ06]|uniref:MSMEG_0567/Sll0786 family nitrogen starvation N-acetyltransferase n=1 Tax=Rhodovulum sp. DZ06 TaxID=3425126 RepID=UPI003D33E889